mmetsp:Transcript_14881/g.40774  ORF Transcript_14881/g.40774 Transcript_14881/m.40774 type:complete len:208 (-) Transcript_14881:102-725(-)
MKLGICTSVLEVPLEVSPKCGFLMEQRTPLCEDDLEFSLGFLAARFGLGLLTKKPVALLPDGPQHRLQAPFLMLQLPFLSAQCSQVHQAMVKLFVQFRVPLLLFGDAAHMFRNCLMCLGDLRAQLLAFLVAPRGVPALDGRDAATALNYADTGPVTFDVATRCCVGDKGNNAFTSLGELRLQLVSFRFGGPKQVLELDPTAIRYGNG